MTTGFREASYYPVQRFIVVDDDRTNNLISKFMIMKHCKNAELELFTDPEYALEVVNRMVSKGDDCSGTIILLDINMPVMNGWEFLDHFANLAESARKQFRIFLFSSSIDLADKQRAAAHSMLSGFFSKPLSAHHLDIALGNAEVASPI